MEIWVWWIVGFGIFLFFSIVFCLYFWCYSSHKELKKKQQHQQKRKKNELDNKESSLPYHHHHHHHNSKNKKNKNHQENNNHHDIYSLPLPPPSTLRYSVSSPDNLSEHTAIEIDHHNDIIDDRFMTQLSAPPVRFFLHQQRWDQNKNDSSKTLNDQQQQQQQQQQDDSNIHDPSTIDRNLSLSPFLGITHVPSPSISAIRSNSSSPNSKAKSSWNWKRY